MASQKLSNASAFTGRKYYNLENTGIAPILNIYVIAGGGGGGFTHSGGGGAGGFAYGTFDRTYLAGSQYTVVVGTGGATSTSRPANGSNGTNSSFGSIIAIGGGGGGSEYKTGSSGGNAGGDAVTAGIVNGTQSSGIAYLTTYNGVPYSGGQGGASFSGGGGGGAGQNGHDSAADVSTQAGLGGRGTNLLSTWLTAISSSMSGVSGWQTATSGGYIAGGGGGGVYGTALTPNWTAGTGGAGGGGTGSTGGSPAANATGITNTGSGGGAGGYPDTSGGNGGSGIVILSYPTYFPAASATTGSPIYISNYNNYRVYAFTGSGTITL